MKKILDWYLKVRLIRSAKKIEKKFREMDKFAEIAKKETQIMKNRQKIIEVQLKAMETALTFGKRIEIALNKNEKWNS
jgi:hypothetical protein